MRTLAIVTGALLAAVACCPFEADDLALDGEAPPNAELVVQVAQERCDRRIVGRIRWVDESLDGTHKGYCHWGGDGCPMDAWVVRYGVSAQFSSLAHEIGHWCLLSEDEDAVEKWARSVNLEVGDILIERQYETVRP
jgi:hypothetical protein